MVKPGEALITVVPVAVWAVEDSGRDIFGFAVTLQGIQAGELGSTPANEGGMIRAKLPGMQGEGVGAGKSGVTGRAGGVGHLVAMQRIVLMEGIGCH